MLPACHMWRAKYCSTSKTWTKMTTAVRYGPVLLIVTPLCNRPDHIIHLILLQSFILYLQNTWIIWILSLTNSHWYITLCCNMHCFQMNQKIAPSGWHQFTYEMTYQMAVYWPPLWSQFSNSITILYTPHWATLHHKTTILEHQPNFSLFNKCRIIFTE